MIILFMEYIYKMLYKIIDILESILSYFSLPIPHMHIPCFSSPPKLNDWW